MIPNTMDHIKALIMIDNNDFTQVDVAKNSTKLMFKEFKCYGT